jgi:hypothetical protein
MRRVVPVDDIPKSIYLICGALDWCPLGSALRWNWRATEPELAMAIPARLSRSLHRALGDQGADDLVNWMVKVESNRSELTEVMTAWRAATDAEFAAIDARFATVEVRFDGVDRRLDGIDRRLEGMEKRLDDRITELFKWSFVFWLGSVGVFAGLVRPMR